MLRHDGRGNDCSLECGRGNDRSLECECGGVAEFKCRDCAYGRRYCKACILRRHNDLPLHRLLVSTTSILSPPKTHSCVSIGRENSIKIRR
jgi:hypothetical protein